MFNLIRGKRELDFSYFSNLEDAHKSKCVDISEILSDVDDYKAKDILYSLLREFKKLADPHYDLSVLSELERDAFKKASERMNLGEGKVFP